MLKLFAILLSLLVLSSCSVFDKNYKVPDPTVCKTVTDGKGACIQVLKGTTTIIPKTEMDKLKTHGLCSSADDWEEVIHLMIDICEHQGCSVNVISTLQLHCNFMTCSDAIFNRIGALRASLFIF